jgi:hypothetical protein
VEGGGVSSNMARHSFTARPVTASTRVQVNQVEKRNPGTGPHPHSTWSSSQRIAACRCRANSSTGQQNSVAGSAASKAKRGKCIRQLYISNNIHIQIGAMVNFYIDSMALQVAA